MQRALGLMKILDVKTKAELFITSGVWDLIDVSDALSLLFFWMICQSRLAFKI